MPRRATQYPILDDDRLSAHPRAARTRDIGCIAESAQCVDWVTWNVVRLLQRRDTASWWPTVFELALAQAPELNRTIAESALRSVDLWRLVPPPTGYGPESRRRTSGSEPAEFPGGVENPAPVEDPTEVDIAFEGEDFLLFVATMLYGDMATGPAHDPSRHQIVRTIDCVIEEAGSRLPCFWMVVRDRHPGCLYTQTVAHYGARPEALAAALPHRNPAVLSTLASGLAIIEWRDLLPLLPDSPELSEVSREVRRRVA